MFLAAAAEFYGLDSARIRLANISGFDEFYHKMEVMASNMDSFTNQILMPGMVIHSNSGLTDGNLVTWHFTTNDFYAKDYHMRVQSRIINRWMIVIIAAVVFFITGILITWLVLKRKK